jgi:hypothetical protein
LLFSSNRRLNWPYTPFIDHLGTEINVKRTSFLVVIAAGTVVLLTASSSQAISRTPQNQIGGTGGPDRFTVLQHTDDRCGRWGVLRQGYWNGTKGNNYVKINVLHNVTNIGVWSFVIRAPGCGAASSGTSRTYGAYAYKEDCSDGLCEVTDTRQLKLVQEFRLIAHDNKPFGAVTLYCLGETLCPAWINTAIPLPDVHAPLRTGASDDTERSALGYAPIDVGTIIPDQ